MPLLNEGVFLDNLPLFYSTINWLKVELESYV